MSTELLEPRSSDDLSEELEVFHWRLEQFRILGFSEPDVLALSHSDADLGEARRLQRMRCPQHLAVRILL
jgi:hypothetical protein